MVPIVLIALACRRAESSFVFVANCAETA